MGFVRWWRWQRCLVRGKAMAGGGEVTVVAGAVVVGVGVMAGGTWGVVGKRMWG